MIEIQSAPDSSVICRPHGALDIDTATELRHLTGEILHPELDLVFDLSQVDYIDAVGASALVGSVRRVRAVGGQSRLSQVNPRVQWVLEVIGIEKYLAANPASGQSDAA